VARKPLAGTVAANVLAHGVGGLNIDACRVGSPDVPAGRVRHGGGSNAVYAQDEWTVANQASMGGPMPAGRWPANVVLAHHPDCGDLAPCADGCWVTELDRQSGTRKTGAHKAYVHGTDWGYGGGMGGKVMTFENEASEGGASRFFPTFRYEAKAPTRERPKVDGQGFATVKPLALMRWLVKLVTPPGGLVLDPFLGSGTTVEAAVLEGARWVGCELHEEHVPYTVQRLERVGATVPAPSLPPGFDWGTEWPEDEEVAVTT
jgi:site-specific DNA-methyltransferase (adenine-specific)